MEIKNTKAQDLILVSKVIDLLKIDFFTIESVEYVNKVYKINLHSDLVGSQLELTFFTEGKEVNAVRKVYKYNDARQEKTSIVSITRLGQVNDKYMYLVVETENREDTAVILNKDFYEGDFYMPSPNQKITDEAITIGTKPMQRRRD